MKILLASPRGFCAGVNMAIEAVNRVLELKGPPIYVFHEIVHNRHVVEDFERRGVIFVEELEEVPEGGIVVYSAHGVSPDMRRLAKHRQLIQVDATCPLVTKVHLEVLRFAREGYRIVFIGHKNHDEAVGTVGEAPDSIDIVESVEDVKQLGYAGDAKLAYVTQTTLSVADAGRIIGALKERWPGIQGPAKEDICYATTNRQNAVSVLSKEVDVVVVIGSHNSSNSKRLVETGRAGGKDAYLIDDASELQMKWFEGKRGVLVTAGASAPEQLVEGVVEWLKREVGGVVEVRALVEERVAFELPRSVRGLETMRESPES